MVEFWWRRTRNETAREVSKQVIQMNLLPTNKHKKKHRAKSVWDKIAHTHKECAQSGFVDVYRLSEECVRWQWMAIHMIWLIRRHSGLFLWIRYAKQSMAMLVNSTHSDSKRKKCLVFDAHKHDFMNGNACYQRQIDVIFLHEKIYSESWDTLLSK